MPDLIVIPKKSPSDIKIVGLQIRIKIQDLVTSSMTMFKIKRSR